MVTSIETKQETFQSRFEGEQKKKVRASGSKRRILLVFVIKSQRKLRLRRNEKRFNRDSKENGKEDLSEA
ncbi:unnamed protein product [Brassica oleracea]